MSTSYGHSGGSDIDIGETQMVAVYTVNIEGVERTRKQLERLQNAADSFGQINQLRKAQYSASVPNVTIAAQTNTRDLLVTKFDDLVGSVQAGTQTAMASGMALGRQLQADALNAATTKTGLSGKPKHRKTAGRNVSTKLINSIKTNVETLRSAKSTRITGWHGWPVDDRQVYFYVQEKGSAMKKIEAANSLGKAALTVREHLVRELGKLKK